MMSNSISISSYKYKVLPGAYQQKINQENA